MCKCMCVCDKHTGLTRTCTLYDQILSALVVLADVSGFSTSMLAYVGAIN